VFANSCLTPQEGLQKLADTGMARGEGPLGQLFLSSVMGGAFLSLGCSMFCTLAGGSLAIQAAAPGIHAVMSGAIFPIGLTLIVLSGTNLFTGDILFGWLPFMTNKD
jgi:formate/nitrite transporter FocA (FNT family)